ncbi:hypothetical protein GCM10010967_32270 [Dyadobacter beijingensis]|uniref:Lipoprotein n=1 Tax=Dyadobacter beijingensis TaxID=365489 RepID=A0ABQ2I3K7_9BACT|nr:hypothetical protein [Dyadobacter beijingensis]GGM96241.1 hypothetical protein GCM10010967_32270 [Dyadobacter beijingensis]
MKALKYLHGLMAAGLLAGSITGCKVVETRENWDAFNKELPNAASVPRNLPFFDTQDYFYRMNIYWRRVEITPPARKDGKPDTDDAKAEDFTYKWFTTYDRDPNLSKDSLIQNVVLYLFSDGRAIFRTVVYPEPGTRRPWKVKWAKSYDLDTGFLHTSQQYVKKNKIKFGRYRMIESQNRHDSTKVKIDLYNAVRSKKLLGGGRFKERQDRVSLYVDLFRPRTVVDEPDPADTLKTTIASFVKGANAYQQSTSKSKPAKPAASNANSEKKPNTDRLTEPARVNDSAFSRAQVEYIDLKSDIGSNGGEVIKITPDLTFGFGELPNKRPAEMYFRLFKLRK